MPKVFKHFDLRVVSPAYDSPLTNIVMDLQFLRRMRLGGSTPPQIFFQLKDFFHLLESINSARIEGNRTTVAEAIEARMEPTPNNTDAIREITNVETAMRFIEEQMSEGAQISKGFILELHKKVVDGLIREGDPTPGAFRAKNVEITNSPHVPPDLAILQDYLEEFFKFINEPLDAKLDLLRVAIAHHRFAWIHPFNNGNGRVVRLLTYAMLISRGFNVRTGRLLNPSAVFCSNRNKYYALLSAADSGTDETLLSWSNYVLTGLLEEMQKIDKLLSYDFLKEKILKPAVLISLERKIVTDLEARILSVAIEKQTFQASDIKSLTPNKIPAERSRILGRMRENRLIEPISENARRYGIRFSHSLLSRGLIQALDREGFITVDETDV
jgi:Fic family protein